MATLMRFLAASFALALAVTASAAAKKPNVIFILADDLGYGDLGCFGQTKIKTPNLDRMDPGLRPTVRAIAQKTSATPLPVRLRAHPPDLDERSIQLNAVDFPETIRALNP